VRWAAGIAALVCVAAESAAAPARVWIEPAALGVERLDSTWEASGLDSRTAVRLGCGVGVDLGHGLGLGVGVGTAAGTTTFGLFAGPTARLVRTDATVELRARAPFALGGWRVQAALGGGRLRLAYRPDQIVLDTSGGAIAVDLAPVHAWTRHVAAEVLHPIGRSSLFLRGGARWYGLDVATPTGMTRQTLCDLQCGVGVRVATF
jgi:hypothetical protein